MKYQTLTLNEEEKLLVKFLLEHTKDGGASPLKYFKTLGPDKDNILNTHDFLLGKITRNLESNKEINKVPALNKKKAKK